MIHFDIRTVYIRFIGTHKEYDKIDCSKIRLLAKVLLCCIGINECGNESNSKPKTRMATIVVLCNVL